MSSSMRALYMPARGMGKGGAGGGGGGVRRSHGHGAGPTWSLTYISPFSRVVHACAGGEKGGRGKCVRRTSGARPPAFAIWREGDTPLIWREGETP